MLITISQVAVVGNNRSMNKLPKLKGLLSYRTDDEKLYLKANTQWKALATQKDVSYILCIQPHSNKMFALRDMRRLAWLLNEFAQAYGFICC